MAGPIARLGRAAAPIAAAAVNRGIASAATRGMATAAVAAKVVASTASGGISRANITRGTTAYTASSKPYQPTRSSENVDRIAKSVSSISSVVGDRVQLHSEIHGVLSSAKEKRKEEVVKTKELMKTFSSLMNEKEGLISAMDASTDAESLKEYVTSLEKLNTRIMECIEKFHGELTNASDAKVEMRVKLASIQSNYQMQTDINKFIADMDKEADVNDVTLKNCIAETSELIKNQGSRCDRMVKLATTYAEESSQYESKSKKLLDLEKDSPEYKVLEREILSHKDTKDSLREQISKIATASKEDSKILINSSFIDSDRKFLEKMSITYEDINDLRILFLNSKCNYGEFKKALEKKYKSKYKEQDWQKLSGILLRFIALHTHQTMSRLLVAAILAGLFMETFKTQLNDFLHGADTHAKDSIIEKIDQEQTYLTKDTELFGLLLQKFKKHASGRNEALNEFQKVELLKFDTAASKIKKEFEEKLSKIKPSKVNSKNFEKIKIQIDEAKTAYVKDMKILKDQLEERTGFFKSRKAFAVKFGELGAFIRSEEDRKSISSPLKEELNAFKNNYLLLHERYNINKNLRVVTDEIGFLTGSFESSEGNLELDKNKWKSVLSELSDHCSAQIEVYSKAQAQPNKVNAETKRQFEEMRATISKIKQDLTTDQISPEKVQLALKEIQQKEVKEIHALASSSSKLESTKDDLLPRLLASKEGWISWAARKLS